MFTVEVVAILPPRKPSCLAEATAKIILEDGEYFVVSDLRILKNRNAQTWVALPTYSIKEGAGWRYEATVELSRELRRKLEDAVIGAYESQRLGTKP
jgi:DNA-binding cell septation regulator SpoVG